MKQLIIISRTLVIIFTIVLIAMLFGGSRIPSIDKETLKENIRSTYKLGYNMGALNVLRTYVINDSVYIDHSQFIKDSLVIEKILKEVYN